MTPSLTGHPLVDLLVATAAVLTALATIWRRAVRPVVHTASMLSDVWDTVQRVDAQLQNNGGGSVKDAVDRIERLQLRVAHRQIRDNQYLHTRMHELINILAAAELGRHTIERLEALAEALKKRTIEADRRDGSS